MKRYKNLISKFRFNKQQKSFNDKANGGRANAKLLAEQFAVTIEADIVRGEYISPHRNKISIVIF